MEKNKRQVPRLRFPGFNDAWEQRKLGELYKKNTERNELKFPIEKTISIAKMVFNPEGNGALSESLVNYRVLRVGDIAFEGHKNKDFLFGRFVLNDVGNGIMSPRFSSLRPIEYLNISFWKQYIHYEPIMRGILKNSTKLGTMMNELVIDDFLKQPIDVPTLKEQTAIGDFFRQLDAAIASHQRKLERTNKLKKSLLQKMFPKDGEAFPELRFPDFTDAWEQRKLGEVAERVTRKNTEMISKLPLTISAQYGLIAQTEFFDKQIASKNISGYYLIKNGEFAYNKSYSNGYPWGAVKRLNNYDYGVLSTLYIVFKPTNINSQFLVSYYDTNYWHNQVASIAVEGARNHGLLNISASEFFTTTLAIPKSIQEQTAIGDFFRQLDAAIASHQRKPVHQKVSKIKQADTISACCH